MAVTGTPDNLPSTRTEWAVWFWLPDVLDGELVRCDNRERADYMANYWNGRPETRPVCTVMKRTITVGPWVTSK